MSDSANRHPADVADRRAAGDVARTLIAELTHPVPSAITRFVAALVGLNRPLGVLFYGSVVRALDTASPDAGADTVDLTEGVLDFYVIVDRQNDWPRPWSARVANALLPPNVEYHEQVINGHVLRAKVAILSLGQFRRLTRPQSLDTTLWARFSQPVRLVWVRDPDAADAILRCIIRAVGTAALWAGGLGPRSGEAETYWRGLFDRTYGAELRVESTRRPASLLKGAEARYQRLLPLSWRAGGCPVDVSHTTLTPTLPPRLRATAARRWRRRAALGRPLNIARLAKAAFTFTGGTRYLLWKIERHTGIAIEATPFAERHPLLAAPGVILKLIRAGAFSRS